jgi:CubicO group peptidase (beta-lactamase class C family)
VSAGAPSAAAEALPRASGALAQGIAEGMYPGAQLYVSRHRRHVAELALGEARPGVPMTRDTLLLWLSSTKPVAAIAVAQMWERGWLELDDPIARHVPEFGVHGKEGITLRHALTHTGGFRLLQLGWPEASWEAIVARISAMRREPRWQPGEKAGYHVSSSWFLLGEVVRRLSGRPFPDYVREEIFQPLAMDDCWIGMPAERFRAYLADGRLAAYRNTEPSPAVAHAYDEELEVTRCSPGGNGWGPLRQLARLYECLLAGGELAGTAPGPAGVGPVRRILRPQTVEALTARHRTGMFDHTFGQVMDWGLGVIPNSRPGLVETWEALRRTEAGTSATTAEGEGSAPRPIPRLPYHYGPHASRRAYGHSGYRSSTAFADPTHGLVVALGITGTPAEAVLRRHFDAVLAAVYEDLGLAAAEPP